MRLIAAFLRRARQPLAAKESDMTLIQIIDTFTFYGLDVLALAAATCLVTQLFKKTLLKRNQKKVITFLPFIIGCLLYAAYYALYNLSFKVLLDEYVHVLEHGFSVGALSTVLYVWYEQFIRGEKTTSASVGLIATLIEGYVPSDDVESIAKSVCEAIEKDVTGDGAQKAADILLAQGGEGINENNAKMLAKLIIETLAHMDK